MTTRSRLWFALVPGLTVSFIASLFYFVIFADHLWARAAYAAVKVFLVVWPLICVYLVFHERIPRPNLRDMKHWKAARAGIVIGVVIVAVVLALMATPLGDIIVNSAGRIRAKAVQLGFMKYYIPFTLFLSVIHSFIEEYFWRWFVYGHLRRLMRMGPALLLAGIGFASHHIIIATQFFPWILGLIFGLLIGCGGVLWCLMLEKQKTLMGAYICHLIVDFGIMAVGYRVLMGG